VACAGNNVGNGNDKGDFFLAVVIDNPDSG
jgi:hypothetical protein